MTNDEKIRDEKLQYNISWEAEKMPALTEKAAKISALSSGKIDKYEFPAGEETLLSDQSRITEQAKFTY